MSRKQMPWEDESIAPNGRPVKDNFAECFGQSKVVDSEGKPLVVYHGTASDDCFTVFEPAEYGGRKGAFWFTADKEMADGFAQWGHESTGAEPRTMVVYLSIKNPLVIDSAEIMKHGDHSFDAEYAAIERAQRGGYDGLLVCNVPDMDRVADQWVALKPTQIKSVIGNNGNYDRNNPSMTDHTADDEVESRPLRERCL